MKVVFSVINSWQKSQFNTVWVSDTSPGEGARYKEMSYEEFARRHNFKPIETTVPFPIIERVYVLNHPIKNKITAYLSTPHNKLFLAPMDQPLNTPKIDGLGYAIYYAPKENKPIKAGTMVSHYAGELIEKTVKPLYDYEFTMSPSVKIDAEHRGNLSRFFAHLPSPGELKFFVMPRRIRNAIATANLEIQPHEENGKAALAIVANKSIEPGNIMGFSYNIEYFLARGTLPVYYDKKGMPIDLSKATFDMRRYVIFQMFNQQITLLNELISKGARIKPEWANVLKKIETIIAEFNTDKGHYFDSEAKFKEIFPELEEAYGKHGLANALKTTQLGSEETAKLVLCKLKEILFFNHKAANAPLNEFIIELFFKQKFQRFPKEHPHVSTHTLNLSTRQLTPSEASSAASSSGFFASTSSLSSNASSTTPSSEPAPMTESSANPRP